VAVVETGFWDLFLGVVSDPEQLFALSTPQELRLGDTGLLPRGGGVQSGAGHARSCNARCAEIEQEDAPKLVPAPVDDVELIAHDLDAAIAEHFAELPDGGFLRLGFCAFLCLLPNFQQILHHEGELERTKIPCLLAES
jgi:hypothetical protein